jgi:hypothetical protein
VIDKPLEAARQASHMISHMDLEKKTAVEVADAFTILFTSVYVALTTEEGDSLEPAQAVVEDPPAKTRRSRKARGTVSSVQGAAGAEQEPSGAVHALPPAGSGDEDEDYA